MNASIVIPSYNSLNFLKRTLSALEKQDIGFDRFEVIVVVDGSTDGTDYYLKNYEGAINLIPITNSKNLGRARSRNRAIEASKNEVIIFLDSDIEVNSDFVRLHMEQHERKKIACVGKVLFSPEIIKNRFMRYLDSRGAARMVDGETVPGKYFRTTNSSVPRDVLAKIGNFDEKFTHYGGEDSEIGMRISEQISIIFLEKAIGFNHHKRTLDQTMEVIREYGRFSLPYLLEKHPEFSKDVKIYSGSKEVLYSLFCSFPIYLVIKLISKLNIVPSFVYSYLLMRSYREGFYLNKKLRVK